VRQRFTVAVVSLLAVFQAVVQFGFAAERDGYIVVLRQPGMAERVRQLATEPRLRRQLLQSPEMQVYRQQLESSQDRLAGDLSASFARAAVPPSGQPDVEVTGRRSLLLNALFVKASPKGLESLRNHPLVKAVYPNRRRRLQLDDAPEIVGAPAVWQMAGGSATAGAGVRIGIVDSGINQNHPMFSSPGLVPPAGFPRPSADSSYTNNKVIVARNYVTLANFYDPQEVHSPADEMGHGTSVASIAAGVRAEGPLSPIQGIAPGAFLGSYKVFGAPGINESTTTAGILAALDDAVADGMQIINMSMGGFPIKPELDPEQQQIALATGLGVLFVIAAGNEGPDAGTITSPGTAPEALTVGATASSQMIVNSIEVTSASPVPADLKQIASLPPDGHPISQPMGPYPVVSIRDQDPGELACSPLTPGSLSGKAAIIRRGTCTFQQKLQNAKNAGAVAAVVYNQFPTAILRMGGVTVDLPAVMIPLNEGQRLVEFSSANATKVLMQPDDEIHAMPVLADAITAFSSRGPGTTLDIKPELVAPGQDIVAATKQTSPTPGYSLALAGTSFSAPIVVGGAALIKSLNPDLSAEEIKSLLVTSADRVATWEGAPARIIESGGGRVNLARAAALRTLVKPSMIGFGVTTESADRTLNQLIRIENIGSAPVLYHIEVVESSVHPHANLVLSASSLLVQPQQTGEVLLEAVLVPPLVSGVFDGFLRIRSDDGQQEMTVSYWGAIGVEDRTRTIKINAQSGAAALRDELRKALPGNRIEITDNAIYDGSLKIGVNEDGVPLNGLSIRSTGQEKATIEAISSSDPNIIITAPGQVELEGFVLKNGLGGLYTTGADVTLRNIDAAGYTAFGVVAEGGRLSLIDSSFNNSTETGVEVWGGHLALVNSRLIGNRRGLLLYDSGGLISGSQISQSWDFGMTAQRKRVGLYESTFFGNLGTNLRLEDSLAVIRDCAIVAGGSSLADGVYGSQASVWAQDNLIDSNGAHGVSLHGTSDFFLLRNRFQSNEKGALSLDAGCAGLARSNWFGNNAEGILVRGSFLTLGDSIIYGTTKSGAAAIELQGGEIALHNVTVGQNTGVGVRVLSGNHLITNSIFSGNAGGDFSGASVENIKSNLLSGGQFAGQNDNIQGDPLFVNPSGDDFSLRGTSPAIDRANPELGISESDINGHERAVDGGRGMGINPDLGAFEYGSGAAPRLILPVLSTRAGEFVGLAVVNTSAKASHIRLQGYTSSGTTFGKTFEKDIAPRSQFSILLAEALESVEEGWVEIQSDQPDLVSFSLVGNYALTQMDGAQLAPASASRVLFPEVRATGGVQTRFFLVNPNPEALEVVFAWYPDGASPRQRTVSIPAKGAINPSFADLFGMLGEGYVSAAVESGKPVFGLELFGPPHSIGGLLALDVSQAASRLYGAQLASTQGVETVITLVNVGQTPAAVTLEAFAENGTLLGSTAIPNLGVNARFRRTARQVFGFTSDVVGWLKVRSNDARLLGNVSFSDNSQNFLAALPLQPRGAHEFVLGHVAQTAEAFTGVTVLNASADGAAVLLEVFDRANVQTGQVVMHLRAGEKRARLLPEFIPGFGRQEGGYVRIRANVPLFSFELFGHPELRFMSAVPQQVTVAGFE